MLVFVKGLTLPFPICPAFMEAARSARTPRWNSSTTSILGFGVALSPMNLLYALIGVLLGTLIGVLPGIGPVATIAMLLPITFTLDADRRR